MSASNLIDLPPSPSHSASNTNHLSQSATNYHHSRSVPIFDDCSDPSAVWVEGAGAEAARVGRHNRCVVYLLLGCPIGLISHLKGGIKSLGVAP